MDDDVLWAPVEARSWWRRDPLRWPVFTCQCRDLRAGIGTRLRARHGAPLEPTRPGWAIGLVAAVYLPFVFGGRWALDHTSSSVAVAATYALLAAIVAVPAFLRRGLVDRPVTLGRGHGRAAVVTYVIGFVATVVVAIVLHPFLSPEAARPLGDDAPGLTFVLVVVIGPITEELMFRGWLLGALRRRLRLGGALVVSSAVFGLAHHFVYGGWGVVSATVSGLVYGGAAIVTGSLVPGILAHSMNNVSATASAEGFPWVPVIAFSVCLWLTWLISVAAWSRQRARVIPEVCADDATWSMATGIVSGVATRIGVEAPVVELAKKAPAARFNFLRHTLVMGRPATAELPLRRLEAAIGFELALRLGRKHQIMSLIYSFAKVLLLLGFYSLVALAWLNADQWWLWAIGVTTTAVSLVTQVATARWLRHQELIADETTMRVFGAEPVTDNLRRRAEGQSRRQQRWARLTQALSTTNSLDERFARVCRHAVPGQPTIATGQPSTLADAVDPAHDPAGR